MVELFDYMPLFIVALSALGLCGVIVYAKTRTETK